MTKLTHASGPATIPTTTPCEMTRVPRNSTYVSVSEWHSSTGKFSTNDKYLPLRLVVAATASCAMTCAGTSGLFRRPSSKALTKSSYSSGFMAPLPRSRSSACMSVSHLPGPTATLEMPGSSTARCLIKEFAAALELPYAPHDVYAVFAAPEETRMILPPVSLSGRIAAFACFHQISLAGVKAGQCLPGQER